MFTLLNVQKVFLDDKTIIFKWMELISEMASFIVTPLSAKKILHLNIREDFKSTIVDGLQDFL